MAESVAARDATATAREPVLLGGLYRFYDDDRGEWLEIPVAVDLGQAIARLDDAYRQRERRHRKRQTTFTDLKGPKRRGERTEPEGVEDRIIDGTAWKGLRPVGTHWSGPHFDFTLLLGIGIQWHGPPPAGEPCACCAGIELPPIACCIACCRTGRDNEIKPPTRWELKLLKMIKPRADGLAGGVERLEPQPKSKKPQNTRPSLNGHPTLLAPFLDPKPPPKRKKPSAAEQIAHTNGQPTDGEVPSGVNHSC